MVAKMAQWKASQTAVYLTDSTVHTKAAYLAVVMVVKMAPQTAPKTTVYLAGLLVPMMAVYLAMLTVVTKDGSVLGWMDGTNDGCLLGYVDGCENGTQATRFGDGLNTSISSGVYMVLGLLFSLHRAPPCHTPY